MRFWRLHLPLLMLAAIPAGALLLVKMPGIDAQIMSRALAPDSFAGLKTNGARFDGSLLLTPSDGSGLALSSRPEPGAMRTVIDFRVHIGFAGRVYLARRPGERIYVQFSSTGPSSDGVFLEKANEATRVQDARALMDAAREAPYLRFTAMLRPGRLDYELNGRKARTPLPGQGWRPDLKIQALSDRSVLLVDDLALWRVAPDGSTQALLRHSFGRPPVVTDLGLLLQEKLLENWVRLASLGILLLAALLLELLLLGLHRWTRSGQLTGLGPAGFLILTWPTQALLLMGLRAATRLSYAAAVVCLGATLLASYLTLIGAGLTGEEHRPPSRRRALLEVAVGFGLYAGAVLLVDRGMAPLALAPLLGALAAALLGRALPPRALVLFLGQAVAGLLLVSGPGAMPAVLWLGLTGVSLLVGVTVHTLRGRVRGGLPARILVVLGATAALLFCLELGLRGVPGIFKHIEAEERQHLYSLVNSEMSDPLGKLKHATRIKVGNQFFETGAHPGTFRVLCLGSSSTNGIGASDPETQGYPARLQTLLRARSLHHVQVIRAGISGCTLSQLNTYMQEVIIHLKPDLVLLYYGANMDSLQARRYSLKLRQLLDQAPYISTPEELWAATMLPYPSPWSISLFLELAKSRIFMAARSLIIIARGRVEQQKNAEKPDELSVLIPETLHELAETCTSRRIPILLIPEVLRTAILTPENPNAGGIKKRTWHYYEMFKAYAREHHAEGVRFLSVHETYTPATVRRLFRDEMHQTAEGYLHLAKTIAAALERFDLLPSP